MNALLDSFALNAHVLSIIPLHNSAIYGLHRVAPFAVLS